MQIFIQKLQLKFIFHGPFVEIYCLMTKLMLLKKFQFEIEFVFLAKIFNISID
jgi:hypothetical protein